MVLSLSFVHAQVIRWGDATMCRQKDKEVPIVGNVVRESNKSSFARKGDPSETTQMKNSAKVSSEEIGDFCPFVVDLL